MGTKSLGKQQQQLIEELETQFEIVEEIPTERVILTFREFVDQRYPKYKWYRHCEVLCEVLQRVADGDLKRVLIFMPPRHGKSLLASKLFPAYYLYRHPDRWTGLTSYGAEMSYTFSRPTKEHYLGVGGKIRKDASAVKHWESIEGGGCWAAGVGGPITGKGYHLGSIDDPLKNDQEAFSDKIRERQKEWFGSTFYTRAEDDASIVLTMTRWHEDDLAGWLLTEEAETDEPEGWHVVNFEAIKEEGTRTFPSSCTVEADWRQPGEALYPEKFPLKRLNKIKGRVGSYFWSALYQQRPTSADGDVFKLDWFHYYTQLPDKFQFLAISVDAAFKEGKTTDFVVIQLWGIAWPNIYLIDQIRDRMGFTKTKDAIRTLISRWKPRYGEPQAKLIEDKANGSAIIEELKREMPGVLAIQPEGGKLARAQAASPYYESGNVWIPETSAMSWVREHTAEFVAFPRGANDDQVDASTQLINWIAQKYTKRTILPDFGTKPS